MEFVIKYRVEINESHVRYRKPQLQIVFLRQTIHQEQHQKSVITATFTTRSLILHQTPACIKFVQHVLYVHWSQSVKFRNDVVPPISFTLVRWYWGYTISPVSVTQPSWTWVKNSNAFTKPWSASPIYIYIYTGHERSHRCTCRCGSKGTVLAEASIWLSFRVT